LGLELEPPTAIVETVIEKGKEMKNKKKFYLAIVAILVITMLATGCSNTWGSASADKGDKEVAVTTEAAIESEDEEVVDGAIVGGNGDGTVRNITQASIEVGAPNGTGLVLGHSRDQLNAKYGETGNWAGLAEIIKGFEEYGEAIDQFETVFQHGISTGAIAEWAADSTVQRTNQLGVFILGGNPATDDEARAELAEAYPQLYREMGAEAWNLIPIFRVDPDEWTVHNSYWSIKLGRSVSFIDVRSQVRLGLVPLAKAESGEWVMVPQTLAWIGSDCRNRFDLAPEPAPIPGKIIEKPDEETSGDSDGDGDGGGGNPGSGGGGSNPGPNPGPGPGPNPGPTPDPDKPDDKKVAQDPATQAPAAAEERGKNDDSGAGEAENSQPVTEKPTVCTNHDWGDWHIETEAQVGVTGYKYHTCKICGFTDGETIPAKPAPAVAHVHNWVKAATPDIPAEVGKPGLGHYVCSECNERGKDFVIDALPAQESGTGTSSSPGNISSP
jgi:hypothetical protein